MTDAEKRLALARRPHHNTMPLCQVDLTAELDLKPTRFALVIPVFAWKCQPLEADAWGHAQVDGYRRALPWHVLSLLRNSDFADADITLYIALSDVVAAACREPLELCHVPMERILFFEQPDLPYAWTNKIIAMCHPELDGYAGVIHSDASNFVCRGPGGERLQVFRWICDNWDTDTQDFLVLDAYPAPADAWGTFQRALTAMLRMSLQPAWI